MEVGVDYFRVPAAISLDCIFNTFVVTLLSGEPEIQFVALRNINLIVQKR